MKKTFIAIVFLLIIGAGYWFLIRPNLGDSGPNNLPTAEEKKRIKDIEESSSQIAPNAVPGAGVRPVGSLPKTPEPTTESTTTASTTQTEVNTENAEEEILLPE